MRYLSPFFRSQTECLSLHRAHSNSLTFRPSAFRVKQILLKHLIAVMTAPDVKLLRPNIQKK